MIFKTSASKQVLLRSLSLSLSQIGSQIPVPVIQNTEREMEYLITKDMYPTASNLKPKLDRVLRETF